MAAPGFPGYGQTSKGTLIPGQSITVNKYNVQVERYLSQGGFAHVYLVRTATPVYGTTHHVLKRIAVSTEAMLSEVKKEVDIMRLLKGHSNIVHLIDAAWHRMQNGQYEVFILMEFCPGGGIIDMMNRRLRERLTEAEILQIFVDVCEGVACMHNLRPPLLHRDLKVENILQSSATSFKLCDFGSATNVSKPPANTQEIRALEADLNRHTTLQYRAPEMIDVYQRRPVDEKSDVWALGVLLYKLCYYTTPFEEHGPLAIMNVQYRIPPYPVYSGQMNALIGSMLREHGYQRPTVFELLAKVHQLRGTQSAYQYTIPVAPSLPPRPKQAPNPVESTVIIKPAKQQHADSPSKNAGTQARDKVLEAIEPMRRGRPRSHSRPSSPQKGKNWMDNGFDHEGDQAWTYAAMKSNPAAKDKGSSDDAWVVDQPAQAAKAPGSAGFGDDFGEKLWDSFDPTGKSQGRQVSSPPSNGQLAPSSTNASVIRNPSPALAGSRRDAFEGLGLMNASSDRPPTLAEARKLRTGLATTSPVHSRFEMGKTSSPRLQYLAPSSQPPNPQSLTPVSVRATASGSSWSSQPPNSRPSSSNNPEAENRFPSLEELDAQFQAPTPAKSGSSTRPPSAAHGRGKASKSSTDLSSLRTPKLPTRPSHSDNGIRSEQVTSNAMQTPRSGTKTLSESPVKSRSSRPSPSRKHHGASTPAKQSTTEDNLLSAATPSRSRVSSRKEPPSPSVQAKTTDWLTGDDSDTQSPLHSPIPSRANEKPVLRQSPSKRASYIEKSSIPLVEASHGYTGTTPEPLSPLPDSPSERANKMFPVIDNDEPRKPAGRRPTQTQKTEHPSVEPLKPASVPELDSSSGEEGPEDLTPYTKAARPPSTSNRPKHKGRQSSVHDLVDLWGGSGTNAPPVKPKAVEDHTRQPSVPAASTKPLGSSDLKRRATATTSAKPRIMPHAQQHKHTPTQSTVSGGAQTSSGAVPRPRPQSMLLFPSKSTGPPTPTSSNLIPPEEPKPRAARRTSITDMVHRFEAIEAHSKPHIRTGVALPGLSAKPSSLITPIDTSTRFTRSPSPGASSTTATVGQNEPDTPLDFREQATRPTPLASLKLADKRSSSPSRRIVPKLKQDSLGAALPPAAKSQPPTPTPIDEAPRSPSPEKPYQGVGRLIDQWQRKTTETNPGQNHIPKRPGGVVPKKTPGLVGRGQ